MWPQYFTIPLGRVTTKSTTILLEVTFIPYQLIRIYTCLQPKMGAGVRMKSTVGDFITVLELDAISDGNSEVGLHFLLVIK